MTLNGCYLWSFRKRRKKASIIIIILFYFIFVLFSFLGSGNLKETKYSLLFLPNQFFFVWSLSLSLSLLSFYFLPFPLLLSSRSLQKIKFARFSSFPCSTHDLVTFYRRLLAERDQSTVRDERWRFVYSSALSSFSLLLFLIWFASLAQFAVSFILMPQTSTKGKMAKFGFQKGTTS